MLVAEILRRAPHATLALLEGRQVPHPSPGPSGDTTPCRMIGVTLHSHIHYTEIKARKWTPVLLSEALLAHDVDVCLERPNGALPPEDHIADP